MRMTRRQMLGGSMGVIGYGAAAAFGAERAVAAPASADQQGGGRGATPRVTMGHAETKRHRTAFLEAGPRNGPLLILLHGWPGMGVVWRQQLEHFAAAGWHCVAPDLRGFGGSSVPTEPEQYQVREIVADMLELHDALGAEPAVWVGHDWGSVVAWAIAAHHADRCRGIASLTVPYISDGVALETIVPFVDRELYPVDVFPAGQWEYWAFYYGHFSQAVADFEADTEATLNVLYQRTSADVVGKRSALASVRNNGGWFGGTHRAPTIPRDTEHFSSS